MLILTPTVAMYREKLRQFDLPGFQGVQALLRRIRIAPSTTGSLLAMLAQSPDPRYRRLARTLLQIQGLPLDTRLTVRPVLVPRSPPTIPPVIAFALHVNGLPPQFILPMEVLPGDIKATVLQIGVILRQGGILRFNTGSGTEAKMV